MYCLMHMKRNGQIRQAYLCSFQNLIVSFYRCMVIPKCNCWSLCCIVISHFKCCSSCRINRVSRLSHSARVLVWMMPDGACSLCLIMDYCSMKLFQVVFYHELIQFLNSLCGGGKYINTWNFQTNSQVSFYSYATAYSQPN